MFSHMEEAGEYPYIRLTTAGGTQVWLLQSSNQAVPVADGRRQADTARLTWRTLRQLHLFVCR